MKQEIKVVLYAIGIAVVVLIALWLIQPEAKCAHFPPAAGTTADCPRD